MPDDEVLRALFADWARGDWTSSPAQFAPGIRFVGAQPEGPVEARGPDGIARFMRGFLADWAQYRVEVHEVEDLGRGRFLARGTQYGTGAAGGVDITAPVWIAVRFEDGLIGLLEFWLEREPAERALA